jgi:hypothetical protein
MLSTSGTARSAGIAPEAGSPYLGLRTPASSHERRPAASTDGIVYDRFHPNTSWVYWQRAVSDEIGGGSNILRRVNLLTGQMQEVTLLVA